MSSTHCEREDAIFIYKIHSPTGGMKIEIHSLCFITNMVKGWNQQLMAHRTHSQVWYGTLIIVVTGRLLCTCFHFPTHYPHEKWKLYFVFFYFVFFYNNNSFSSSIFLLDCWVVLVWKSLCSLVYWTWKLVV